MPEPDLALDRLIHEPGRLAILTVLSSADDADFLFVQRATGLTKGNLSSHLAKLDDDFVCAHPFASAPKIHPAHCASYRLRAFARFM